MDPTKESEEDTMECDEAMECEETETVEYEYVHSKLQIMDHISVSIVIIISYIK